MLKVVGQERPSLRRKLGLDRFNGWYLLWGAGLILSLEVGDTKHIAMRPGPAKCDEAR